MLENDDGLPLHPLPRPCQKHPRPLTLRYPSLYGALNWLWLRTLNLKAQVEVDFNCKYQPPHHLAPSPILVVNMAGGDSTVHNLQAPIKAEELLKQERRDYDCTSCRLVGESPAY